MALIISQKVKLQTSLYVFQKDTRPRASCVPSASHQSSIVLTSLWLPLIP